MNVNGKALGEHLKIVSLSQRVSGAAFGKNFEVTVVDDAEQVIIHAESDVELDREFGISDISNLSKVLASFGDEVNLDFEENDDNEVVKLVLQGEGVEVRYQCAAVDVAQRKRIKWKQAQEKLSSGIFLDATLRPGALKQYDRYTKLIKPQLVKLHYRSKELIATLISEKSHQADVVLGTATSEKKKQSAIQVNAGALSAVLSCTPEPVEGVDITICLGISVLIAFGTYTFFVEPIVEPEFAKVSEKDSRDDF